MTERFVKLTVEEIRALWLAYKDPVRKNDRDLLGTASDKLYDVLVRAGEEKAHD